MTIPETFSTGVARTIGRYSDAVRVPAGYEQIVTSGEIEVTAVRLAGG